jgi:uncharacterized protein
MTDVGEQYAAPTPAAIANPAPLGLAAFALTTFLFSAKNAGWTHGTDAWIGFAFAYGGLALLLAGMWEFRNRNVFGTTFFGTYGSFWLGLGLWAAFVTKGSWTLKAATAPQADDLGWILLAFAIVNSYMLLWSIQVNEAVLAVLLTMQVTEIILCIGFFTQSTGVINVGGYLGVITAICAWYASAATLINEMVGRAVLAVGGPMMMRMPVMRHAGGPTPMAH